LKRAFIREFPEPRFDGHKLNLLEKLSKIDFAEAAILILEIFDFVYVSANKL
jgi:hypothetical protein